MFYDAFESVSVIMAASAYRSVYMYTYVYHLCVCLSVCVCLSGYLSIYLYLYVCVSLSLSLYMYIYIHTSVPMVSNHELLAMRDLAYLTMLKGPKTLFQLFRPLPWDQHLCVAA